MWNAGVFMEYFKDVNGVFSKLPFTNVDTGAGLERLALVLQDKKSVFETDFFSPLIEIIKKHSPIEKKFNLNSAYLIADHIKACVFLISDGVLPSNEHRGYILRRIIRRMFYHKTLIDNKDGGFSDLTGKV